MIIELNVENIAIIESSCLRPEPAFTVLTGETGAGKSLLIDAIELALGERADAELVRNGATKGSVAVTIDISSRPDLLAECESLGIEPENGQIFIQREVAAEGRSQARIMGKLVPIASLKRLGEKLVDLHGQHDHQQLLDVEQHIQALDAWIGAEAHQARDSVRQAFESKEQLRVRLSRLKSHHREREQRIDLLTFQVNEIQEANLRDGELAEGIAMLERLRHVEKLRALASNAHEALDGEPGAFVQIADARNTLESAGQIDKGLDSIVESISQAYFLIEEARYGLSAYLESLETDPAMIEAVDERVEAIKKLLRKYGETEAAVIEHAEIAAKELAELVDTDHDEASLAQALEVAEQHLRDQAALLTAIRKKAAKTFAGQITEVLHSLAMERAQFSVQFEEIDPMETGADAVRFLFSANAGESPKPLHKVASGGELSRLMLAIKVGMAGRGGVPTLIFDEVDSGLSGRAAGVVAENLVSLARHYQVIVISHLSQIACRATTHFRIEKVEIDGRTQTQVRELSPSERVAEIARMLSGTEVTETALVAAREMLTGVTLA